MGTNLIDGDLEDFGCAVGGGPALMSYLVEHLEESQIDRAVAAGTNACDEGGEIMVRRARTHPHLDPVMTQSDIERARANEAAMQDYIRSTVGSSSGTADELAKLAELQSKGVLSEAEFEGQKAKLLS